MATIRSLTIDIGARDSLLSFCLAKRIDRNTGLLVDIFDDGAFFVWEDVSPTDPRFDEFLCEVERNPEAWGTTVTYP